MSYSFYKILHLTSILGLFMALGGMCLHAMAGGTGRYPGRRWATLFHGIGLALIFVAGFGLMARINVHWPWPLWIWIKVAMWVLLGGASALALRVPKMARFTWILILAMGFIAVFAANTKPL